MNTQAIFAAKHGKGGRASGQVGQGMRLCHPERSILVRHLPLHAVLGKHSHILMPNRFSTY